MFVKGDGGIRTHESRICNPLPWSTRARRQNELSVISCQSSGLSFQVTANQAPCGAIAYYTVLGRRVQHAGRAYSKST